LKESSGDPAHNGDQIALASENPGQRSVGELGKIHRISVSQAAGDP
jgi:hypothetical protein